MSPTKSRLFLLYIPIGVVALIFIAYTIVWNIGARGMKQAVNDWIADQRENGMIVNHGKIATGGYPFFLRTTVEMVDIRQPSQWQWQSQKLAIDALPYDLTKIIFSLHGEQNFTIETVPVPFGAWRGAGEQIRASLGLDKSKNWFFILELDQINVSAVYTDAKAEVEKLIFNLGPEGQNQTTIASRLKVDDFYVNIRGDGLDRVIRFGSLQSSIDVTDVDKISDEKPLSDWSAQGGEVKIHHITLADAPAQFVATGTLAVDPQGYATGLVETSLTKPNNFVEIIRNSNLVPKEQVDAMGGGLAVALLASGGVIKTPILLEQGKVSVNGNVVADLPPIQP